jgi:SAM-dependent methyltransferase
MTVQTFDPVAYKEAQRKDWSAAATGWREWWEKIEQGAGSVSERLVELADVRPGERVLDVATGIGEPAVTAAGRVGPAGRIVATDIASGMLEIGKERAAALGLENIEFRQADAEELQVPEEGFDAVLCRFGLMFFPDVGKALERIRAALVPGGRLAAAVWGPPERTPFVAIPLQTVARELQLPKPAPGTPGPLALADADVLGAKVRAAGFDDVRVERETITLPFASAAEFARFMRAVAAPVNNLLADHTPERRDEVWRAIELAAGERAAADGSLDMPGEVIYVAGRR